jgi:hypothetical protein
MMRGLVAVVVMLAMVAFGCGEKTSEGTSPVIDSMAQLPGYKQLDSITKLLDSSPNNTDLLNFRAKLFYRPENSTSHWPMWAAPFLSIARRPNISSPLPMSIFNAMSRNAASSRWKWRADWHLTTPNHSTDWRSSNLYLNKHQESIDLANEMLRIDPTGRPSFSHKGALLQGYGRYHKGVGELHAGRRTESGQF